MSQLGGYEGRWVWMWYFSSQQGHKIHILEAVYGRRGARGDQTGLYDAGPRLFTSGTRPWPHMKLGNHWHCKWYLNALIVF